MQRMIVANRFLIALILFVVVSFSPQMPKIVANTDDTILLMYTSTWDPVHLSFWQIDWEEREKIPYVTLGLEYATYQGFYWSTSNQSLYFVANDACVPCGYSGYLVEFDLIAQETKQLYERENLAYFKPYVDDDHLILQYFPAGLKRSYPGVGGPDSCLFDLKTYVCQEFDEVISQRLGFIMPVYWLDTERFLQGNNGVFDVGNIETGEIETVVQVDDQVFESEFFLLPEPDNILLLAYGDYASYDGTAYFYDFNLQTFDLSLRFSIENIRKDRGLELSPNGQYLVYARRDDFLVIDLDTGDIILERSLQVEETRLDTILLSALTWLPDNSGFVAQTSFDRRGDAIEIVQISLETGQIIPLFDLDSYVGFMKIKVGG